MLLQKEKTVVAILNMQLELIPLLKNGSQLLSDCCWLADMCGDLHVPLMLVEHQKLGKLSASLSEVARGAHRMEKTHFDMMEETAIARGVVASGREHYVLAGAETHVCLLQSAMGLKKQGKEVFVLADTCSARANADHERALARIRQCGIQTISREMFFFELIRHSEYPGYIDLAMKYLDGRYIR